MYWQAIEEQILNENFLVSNQPYNIVGNLKNINNNSDLVYGYFTVASLSQKRIFVNRLNGPFYYSLCLIITDPDAIAEFKRKYDPPYFWVESPEGKLGIIYPRCVDCRTDGGVLNRPDFW